VPLHRLRQHHRRHRIGADLSAAPEKFGQRVRRREDPALLTGQGVYVADLIRPGMAAMRVIRSTQAHARIQRIDFSAVLHDPDCLGTLCGADLPDGIGAAGTGAAGVGAAEAGT